jgi:hypothetical protein
VTFLDCLNWPSGHAPLSVLRYLGKADAEYGSSGAFELARSTLD